MCRTRMAVMVALLAMAGAMLAGCNGVQLNAEYSRLLDQTADLSADTAARAQAGTLPAGDMRGALVYQAFVWQQFRNGRDGVKGDEVPVPPTTQPTALTDLPTGQAGLVDGKPSAACK